MLLRIFTVFALVLCSCRRYPDSYPPPEQRHPSEAIDAEAAAATMMIEMSDPDAQAHFVRDIVTTNEKVQWYWTAQRPTLRILAVETQNLKLVIDFSIWDVGFRQTGPVELSFFVNDRLLDKVRYDSPGPKHFEKPIPADWLKTDVESQVAISIDKLYTAPEDGAKFGIILSRAGFERR